MGAGVICGAGASYATANALKNSTNVSWEINFDAPTNFEQFDIGFSHNEALDQVYYGNISIESFLSEHDLIKSEQAAYIVDNESFNRGYDLIIENSLSFKGHNDIDILIQDHFNDGLLTEDMKTFYHLFFEALVRSNTADDIETTISYYTHHAVQEPYSEIEKQALISSMSVAASSFNYWINM